MPQLKILVRKRLRTINRRRTSPIAINEITTLYHEFFNHSVEFAVFVTLRSAEMVFRFTRAELAEVFCGAWDDVGEEFHFDSTEWLSP